MLSEFLAFAKRGGGKGPIITDYPAGLSFINYYSFLFIPLRSLILKYSEAYNATQYKHHNPDQNNFSHGRLFAAEILQLHSLWH